MAKCPGQDQRFWKPDDIFEINCPDCDAPVEFWKDDPQVTCPRCEKMVTNPRLDITCAKWCKYAKECLGVSSVNSDSILCNTLIEEMKSISQNHPPKIENAYQTLKYAELIQSHEGGNPLIVKAAAILCQVGPHGPQEPLLAKQVLVKHGVDADLIDKIIQIIKACHDSFEINSVEFKIVSDAYRLAVKSDDFRDKSTDDLRKLIRELFKTRHGRQLAMQLFEA